MGDETDDPFPDYPSFEELQDRKPDMAEQMEQIHSESEDGVSDDAKEWYNDAVYVAARLIVVAARENDEFREEFLGDESVGAAHTMSEYDEERLRKLHRMGLSAFQGASAENLARSELMDEGDEDE